MTSSSTESPGDQAKDCTTCHRTLPVAQFSENRSHASGLQYTCKECCCKYQRLHRQERLDRERVGGVGGEECCAKYYRLQRVNKPDQEGVGGMGGECCEEPEPDTGAPAKRQRLEADLYIMAMSIDPDGEVCGFKVGRSGNIQQRVCTLSASMPFNIVVLATFPGAGGLENRVHKALEVFRNDSGPGREWFRTTLTHIVSAVMKCRDGSDE